MNELNTLFPNSKSLENLHQLTNVYLQVIKFFRDLKASEGSDAQIKAIDALTELLNHEKQP